MLVEANGRQLSDQSRNLRDATSYRFAAHTLSICASASLKPASE